MASGEGGPMYCLMSARSTNARSMAPVMLDVVKMITFGYLEQANNKSCMYYYRCPMGKTCSIYTVFQYIHLTHYETAKAT